jgi:hypothetical protein
MAANIRSRASSFVPPLFTRTNTSSTRSYGKSFTMPSSSSYQKTPSSLSMCTKLDTFSCARSRVALFVIVCDCALCRNPCVRRGAARSAWLNRRNGHCGARAPTCLGTSGSGGYSCNLGRRPGLDRDSLILPTPEVVWVVALVPDEHPMAMRQQRSM